MPSDQPPPTRSGHDSPTCSIEIIALIPAQDKETSEDSIQSSAPAIVDENSAQVYPAEPRIADDDANITRFVSGLTLNTIVSVLLTAAVSSLIFVASATVGQSKWRCLRKRHRLHDIQALDDASRGPLGALSALLSFTGGGLAALGSVIILFLVVFSPFLQQLIDYPLRNTTQPHAAALAPQLLAYTPFWEGGGLTRAIEVKTGVSQTV